MTKVTEKLQFSFIDNLRNQLKDSSRAKVLPLVLANKETIEECLNLRFSLRTIYLTWMTDFDPPLFKYPAFRRACIKAGIYTPKKIYNDPALDVMKSHVSVDRLLENLNDNPNAVPGLSKDPNAVPGLSGKDRRRKVSIVRKPDTVEKLPNNQVPAFSNEKKDY